MFFENFFCFFFNFYSIFKFLKNFQFFFQKHFQRKKISEFFSFLNFEIRIKKFQKSKNPKFQFFFKKKNYLKNLLIKKM